MAQIRLSWFGAFSGATTAKPTRFPTTDFGNR
jgi:hypothetical protein